MELTQLRYFQAAAEECNFTRAAKKLNISQPALSKSIQNLEEEIDVKLFIRDGNKLALSSFGYILLDEVKSAIVHLDAGIKNARIRAGLDYGNISLAYSEAINITNPIEGFLEDYPNVHFRESFASMSQMEENLLNGTIDFGITYSTIDNPKIEWTPVYQDRMSVLLPPDHPLAHRKEIRIEELNGERFLQGDNFGRPSSLFDSYANTVFQPMVFYEGTDKSMVGRLVAKHVGVALAPLSVSLSLHQGDPYPREVGAPEVAYVPLVDDYWRKTIGIVSLKDHIFSQAAGELIRRIKSFYEGLPPAF